MKQNRIILIIGVIVAILTIALWNRRKLGIVWDPGTELRLRSLHPSIRDKARKMILTAEDQGIFLRIPPDGGYRDFAEQTRIYNQGRTTDGDIVTNAKPGYSFHNYGLAFDVVEIVDGAALWENPNWPIIGKIGKSLGFQWGGEWKNTDTPHFEKSYGYTPTQLLAMSQKSTTEYIKLT